MTYVASLGSTLVARSAIAPEGPWSAPVALESCALDAAGPGTFCAGGRQHPELAPGTSMLALTYSARTLPSDAGVAPESDAFCPRLVTLAMPSALP